MIPLPFSVVFTSPGPALDLGPISLRWYGLIIATAVFIGIGLSQHLARRRHLDPDLIPDLAIVLVLAAVPAARLYYVAFEWDYYQNHLDQIIQVWQGGIAIHGAIFGGLLATIIFSKVRRVSLWQLLDVVAPSLILGQAMGRWGNFFNSEAFGAPTDLPWKLYIPPTRRPPGLRDVSFYHPTFLYESLWNLGLFGILLWFFYRFPQARPGTIVFIYALGYGLGRIWIEGLRTDSLMLGPVRIAQVMSLLFIGVGLGGLIWAWRGGYTEVKPPQQS